MKEDIIYANFQPTEAKLLKNGSGSQLLIDNPILSSVLSKIFPYLLLIDNVLEILTWTNEDLYSNLLLIILYSILIMYWNYMNLVVIPILVTLCFGYIIWIINSIVYDTKFNEKPTIDEILSVLHNITIRFEMILRPVARTNLKLRNFLQIFIVSLILIPINFLIVTYILSPQKFLWLFGVFLLTYHSPWSFSIRRLLWRSIYIRVFVFYLTGLNIKLDAKNNKFKFNDEKNDTDVTSNDFKILQKKIESPTRLNQVVKFEVFENERRWIGLGWSKFLLPSERANYCTTSLKEIPDINSFTPPVYSNDLYNYKWEWIDKSWVIDKEFSKNKNNGWIYSDNNWENDELSDGFSKFTRSRKWYRTATLIIDKKLNVYDE
ncbi:peroxisomal membrane protein Pex31p [[Candida] jaroonii]|uniref:Peroxisomal membrane protein Pex31p n=1 Tax=[Candida] jaroonii TaxID=467808 RepID=A0ACA9Y4M9_9ASCO|nr:peroxisomal membrane protein Pex31p [[Candida] jaroonii]